jgi:flavin reductase (DIM6/NTAB) family NADH-FMN oxidoreductase RutF
MPDSTLNPQLIHNALQSIPHATYVLTCCHDQFRDGIITQWVQQCSTDPPMLVVAIPKGRAIEPMLRDARAFALCMVPDSDRRALRLFGTDHEPDEDPFLSLTTDEAVTGMPILQQSLVWFDCKLEGHLSPDADCRLYLGRVVAAHICNPKRIAALLKEDIKPPTTERRKSPRGRATQVSQQFKQ